ncbi:MAG: hypothetical protein LBS30_05420, partial [Planctomycetota bacterium]|nr:hypothetical protein [Planctomycetota bacterium]
MRKRPLFPIAAVLTLVLCGRSLPAAEPPALNPVRQPLLVARAANAALVESVLSTRQARALKLDQKDFPGRVPGVDARVDSARAFLAALVRAGGENIWYGLAQRGGSLVNSAGVMGWDCDGDAAEQLAEMGLDTNGLDVDARDGRIVISRDAATRKELFGGGDALPDDGWRGSLSAFMRGPEDSVGVWANARPLLGFLTLLTGFDLRSMLRARKLGTPVWTRVDLFNNGGDLGFDIRLNNILPKEIRNSDAHPLLVH